MDDETIYLERTLNTMRAIILSNYADYESSNDQSRVSIRKISIGSLASKIINFISNFKQDLTEF